MTSIKVWVVSSLNDETRGPGCHFKSIEWHILCMAVIRLWNAAGWLRRSVTEPLQPCVDLLYAHKTHKWRAEALKGKFATTVAHVLLAKFA